MTGTRPDPDRDPAQHQPGKADHSAESIGKGKDSLQKQTLRETTLDQSGDKKAEDFLSDENGNLTKVQASTVREGDLQDAQRGKGRGSLRSAKQDREVDPNTPGDDPSKGM